MCPILNTVLPTLLGGFIAGIVGVVLSQWQRKRDARNEFLIFISVKKGAIPKEGIYKFHETTRPEIRDAISRVIPFLSLEKSRKLETTWSNYSEIEEYDLDDKNEDDLMRAALALDGETVPEKPSDILKSRLNEMCKIVR